LRSVHGHSSRVFKFVLKDPQGSPSESSRVGRIPLHRRRHLEQPLEQRVLPVAHLWCRAQGSGLRVEGYGIWVEGYECKVLSAGFWVSRFGGLGFGFWAQSLGFRFWVLGSGLEFGFWVLGIGFDVWGLGFNIWS